MSIAYYSHSKLLSLIKKHSSAVGDITAVNAGNGLSGGGASGDVTLAVDINGATDGTGITVSDTDFVLLADADDSNNVKKVYVHQLTASNDEPAGANTQIQFNDNGAFGASANFTFDGSSLQVVGNISGSSTLQAVGATTLGSTLNVSGAAYFADYLTSSHIIPASDGTYDLGEVDNKYENIYGNFYDGAVSFTAINDHGGTITRGQVVYIKGISGQTPTVALASADDPTKMPAMGLVGDGTSNDGTEVRIVTFGSLKGFDTSDFSEGDTLFVETGSAGDAGRLRNTAPTGSNALIQNIGRVMRSDASAGQVKVAGAGRTNATPNLDEGYLFVGNATDQAVQDNTVYVDSANRKVGIGVTGASITHAITLPDNSDTTGKIKANAYLTYSSIRYKKDVEPLEDPLGTLNKLDGVSYVWKDTGKKDYGFIAEEVGKVLPDIVEFAQDSEYANSMDYIRIISFLVEGVKAQDKKIQSLEKKLDLLIEKLDK